MKMSQPNGCKCRAWSKGKCPIWVTPATETRSLILKLPVPLKKSKLGSSFIAGCLVVPLPRIPTQRCLLSAAQSVYNMQFSRHPEYCYSSHPENTIMQMLGVTMSLMNVTDLLLEELHAAHPISMARQVSKILGPSLDSSAPFFSAVGRPEDHGRAPLHQELYTYITPEHLLPQKTQNPRFQLHPHRHA